MRATLAGLLLGTQSPCRQPNQVNTKDSENSDSDNIENLDFEANLRVVFFLVTLINEGQQPQKITL